MEDDMVMALELFMLASNVRKQICLNDFLPFLTKYENKKSRNMIFLCQIQYLKTLGWFFLLLVKTKLLLWWKIMMNNLCFQCC